MIIRRIDLPYLKLPIQSILVDDPDGRIFPCTISCNGYAIAAIRVEAAQQPPSRLLPANKMSMAYSKMLARPATAPDAVVTLAQLLSIVGPAEPAKNVVCGDCKGSGSSRTADVGCACSNCQCGSCTTGRVWTRPPQRPIVLAGVGVNANLVACTLAALEGATPGLVEVWGERDETGWRVRMCAKDDSWRATVLGMNVEVGAPAFLGSTKPAPPSTHPSAAQQTASAAERVVEHAVIARARGTPRGPVVTDAVAYSRLAAMALGTSWPTDDADHTVVMNCIRHILDNYNEAHVLAKAATEFVFLTETSNGSAHREIDGTWTVKHCDGREKGADGKKKPMLAPVAEKLSREDAIAAAKLLAKVGLEAWKAESR